MDPELFTLGSTNYQHVDSSVAWGDGRTAIGVTTAANRAGVVRSTTLGNADAVELMPLGTGMTKSSNTQLAVAGDVAVGSWDEQNNAGDQRQSRATIWRMSNGQVLANPFKITQGAKPQFAARPVMFPDGTVAFFSAEGTLGNYGYRVDVFDTDGTHQRSKVLPAPWMNQILTSMDVIDASVLADKVLFAVEDIFANPSMGREIVVRALMASDLADVTGVEAMVNSDAAGDHQQIRMQLSKGVSVSSYVQDNSKAGGTGTDGKDVQLRVIKSNGSLDSEQTFAGGPGDQHDARFAVNGNQLFGSYIDEQTGNVVEREIIQAANGTITGFGGLLNLSPGVTLKPDGGNALTLVNNQRVAAFLDSNSLLQLSVIGKAPSPLPGISTSSNNNLVTPETVPMTDSGSSFSDMMTALQQSRSMSMPGARTLAPMMLTLTTSVAAGDDNTLVLATAIPIAVVCLLILVGVIYCKVSNSDARRDATFDSVDAAEREHVTLAPGDDSRLGPMGRGGGPLTIDSVAGNTLGSDVNSEKPMYDQIPKVGQYAGFPQDTQGTVALKAIAADPQKEDDVSSSSSTP